MFKVQYVFSREYTSLPFLVDKGEHINIQAVVQTNEIQSEDEAFADADDVSGV